MSKLDEKYYYPGMSCTCAARAEVECACNADWTPKEVYQQAQRIKELDVHVERLRGALGKAINHDWLSVEYINNSEGAAEDMDAICAIYRETPSQSLREIQAEAVEEAIFSQKAKWKCRLGGTDINIDDLAAYAQQLRNGG